MATEERDDCNAITLFPNRNMLHFEIQGLKIWMIRVTLNLTFGKTCAYPVVQWLACLMSHETSASFSERR